MTLTNLAWTSLALAVVSALFIAADEVRRPQAMAVMNLVWPISALYFSVIGLWAYLAFGRAKPNSQKHRMQHGGLQSSGPKRADARKPSTRQVALGTSHCGAGCTIADIGTEFAVAASGLVWFGSLLWTEYVLDFLAAWALGIVFQYFAIKPMRPELSVGEALWAAVKADTLSILAFQVGMYLWMALVHYKLFPTPHGLTPFDPRYWLMMQIAMVLGFGTSFPMNHFLIRRGLKEAM